MRSSSAPAWPGNAAAYTMASRGLKVLQLERGEYPGSKNVQGGILYANMLEKIIPNFREEAPLERHLVEQRFWMMGDRSHTALQYRSDDFNEEKPNRYTIIRSQFDRWFSSEAQAKGAIVIKRNHGHRAHQRRLWQGDRRGDGSSRRHDFRRRRGHRGRRERASRNARGTARDAKGGAGRARRQGNALPAARDDRGALQSAWRRRRRDRGGRHGLEGHDRHGLRLHQQGEHLGRLWLPCRGFRRIRRATPYGLLENFKKHPSIAPLLEGSEVKEYAAHLIPEGGYKAVPQLFGDGWVVVGDAAQLNNAIHREGSNLAMTSGRIAAETIFQIKSRRERDDEGRISAPTRRRSRKASS